MAKFKIDDGFAAYLVKDAEFVGKYQIPKLPKHKELLIPGDTCDKQVSKFAEAIPIYCFT